MHRETLDFYMQGWEKVTQPIWFTVYFTCACSSLVAMVTQYLSYFVTIYNTTVRLRNICQPTKFGTKKNEENSHVRILGQRCVTFAHPCIQIVKFFYKDYQLFLPKLSYFLGKSIKFSYKNRQIFLQKSSHFPEKMVKFSCKYRQIFL